MPAFFFVPILTREGAMTPIRYTIEPIDLAGHLFSVSLDVDAPQAEGQCLSLPAWIPGSYMIRDFARNIVTLEARAGGKAVAVEKLDKQTWRCGRVPAGQSLCVSYTVYAWDLSVRTAHLDQTHGFFNGTSVFLRVDGQSEAPCLVDLKPPRKGAIGRWRVATAMREARGLRGAARRHGFGLYRADNYDELIDHPVEMGDFTLASFEAGGITHEVVLTGRHDCDTERLCADLAKICQWQIDLFGGTPPMERYVFLTMVVGDGYGGLEHRASTALLTSRNELPWTGMKGTPEAYQRFLGLCSHEYFHSWNVKRIKPARFTPYELAAESYTRLLWAFEGFTSYYDDLCLVRSGVIEPAVYLKSLAETITRVERGSGRLKQSVAESSFDAWSKFYKQDENAANAIVSYYTKGSLIALALDLKLREDSGGRVSLDDVMRLLWSRHGETGLGVPEDGVFAAVAELGGAAVASWLKRAVNGTDDLPLTRLLKAAAVSLAKTAAARPSLGVRLKSKSGKAVLAAVHEGSAAHRAGLSAGDELVAIDELRVSADALDGLLDRKRAGDSLQVHFFRRDELMCVGLELLAGEETTQLMLAPKPDATARRIRKAWLGA
jgi:predicted metalloprotease with PDZ domain